MENKQIIFDERNYIYMVKSMALLSIVSAHVGIISDHVLLARFFLLILNSIGTIGVCIFFMISGYLFHTEKKSKWNFFKKKLQSVVLPWLFCGTILFGYVALRKGGFTFLNWMLTILVYSHLYYMTILVLFYILFWKIQYNRYLLIVVSALSVASIVFTGMGALYFVYPYINPMNWAVYFIIGIFIRKKDILYRIASFCRKYLLGFCAVYGIVLSIYLYQGIYISYWNFPSFFIELIAAGCILGLSGRLIQTKCKKLLVYVGKISFSVYLLHTPVAGVITYLLNNYNLWYLILIAPATIVLLTGGILVLFDKVSKVIRIQKIFRMVTGLRS